MVSKEELDRKEGPDFAMIEEIVREDVQGLQDGYKKYGNSWRRYAGVSAFFNIFRKVDRIEKACIENGYDIFLAAKAFPGDTGLLDDVRDCRRYLLLVEEYIIKSGEKNG